MRDRKGHPQSPLKHLVAVAQALLLVPLSTLHGADAPGELVFVRDFRMGEASRMPGPASTPGLRVERQDHPDAGWMRCFRVQSDDPIRYWHTISVLLEWRHERHH